MKFPKHRTLHKGRIYFVALFFISAYSGMKVCPLLLDISRIPVLPRNFRNASSFTDSCKCSPSVKYVSSANLLCKDVDITTKLTASLTFRHRASCILGQAFHYSPENAFYIFNQQIYFII